MQANVVLPQFNGDELDAESPMMLLQAIRKRSIPIQLGVTLFAACIWAGLSGVLGPGQTKPWALFAVGFLAAASMLAHAPRRSAAATVLRGIVLLVAAGYILLDSPPSLGALAFACSLSIIARGAAARFELLQYVGSALIVTSLAEFAFRRAETLIHSPLRKALAGMFGRLGAERVASAELSATYLGLTGLVFGTTLCALAFARANRLRLAARAGGFLGASSLILLTWGVLVIATPLEGAEGLELMQGLNRHVGLLIIAVTSVSIVAASPAVLLATSTISGDSDRRTMVPFTLAGAIVALAVAFRTIPPRPEHAASNLRIAVLESRGIDWKRPSYGWYGDFSSGMFGLFPEYATRESVEVRQVTPVDLNQDVLKRFDILITINATTEFQEGEIESISRFVAGGGALLALCDHTDVFGQMKGTNRLLERFNMALRFDSGYAARQPWSHCLLVDQQMASWSGPEPFYPGVGVGCSLDAQWPAQSLWVGRYAFSDRGEYGNVQGAYLGNYALDPGERLGDVLLAAWRNYGAGKVAVFGDTSFFQNSALTKTWKGNVLPLLHWLAGERRWHEGELATTTAILLTILAGVGVFARPIGTSSMACGLLLGLAAVRAYSDGVTVPSEPAPSDHEIVVDLGHQSRIGHWESRWNDIGPLYRAIQREGFVVRQMVEPHLGELGQPRALVIIDPAQPYKEGEVNRLADYAISGGRVILCLGPVGARSLDGFLAQLGLTIGTESLGSMPQERAWGNADDGSPRFREAYPILATNISRLGDLGYRVLYTTGKEVLALSTPMGRGFVIVIGDPRFFSSANIEGGWGHHVGNITFVYNLFEQLIGSRRDEVRALFPTEVARDG